MSKTHLMKRESGVVPVCGTRRRPTLTNLRELVTCQSCLSISAPAVALQSGWALIQAQREAEAE